MDTFMDKLAQRFTAQEMINANSAADAEELERLKEQVKEYSDCLTRMQDVCKQLEQTAADAKEKIEDAKVDGAEIERLVEAGIQKIQSVQQETEILGDLKRQLTEIQTAQGNADENVHRECVRTYRNVQAVVTEETAKQSDKLDEGLGKMKVKINIIFVVSLLTMLFSLTGTALQVLIWLHIL